MKIPSRVVIVGGTHGNEWTGITIVNHYQDYLSKKYPNLTLEFIFANPAANQANARFKDEDLNRAFQFLNEVRTSYEHIRAKEIKAIIQREPCLVLDLHTTTSSMGNTLIVPSYNPLILSLCAKLQQKFKDCRVIGSPDPKRKFVASQSDFGLILEIGPVSNSIVAAIPLEVTLALIEQILGTISSSQNVDNGEIEIYEETQDIRYPKNEKGELNGYIHSEFQGKNFHMISGKFHPFMTFQNQVVEMKTDENLYPIFINEAAYYPQDLAFTLCRKKTLTY
jgi:aspartoacylase